MTDVKRPVLALIAAVVFMTAVDVRADSLTAINTSLSLGEVAVAAVEDDLPTVGGDAWAAGTWSFQSYGSATLFNDKGDIYLGHVGVGYHIWDDISINFEVIGGEVTQRQNPRDDSSYTVGFELLGRWHFLKGEGWSIYADGGAGIVWFENEWPAGGTHQNFTPQAGVGATLRLFDNVRAMGGVRWHHVSNARKSGEDNNPGFDGAMFYFGLIVPF